MRIPKAVRYSLILLVGGSSILSACTVSAAGGIGGGVVTVLLVLLFAGGTATTQTGCTPGKDEHVGPCLTPPPPDIQYDTSQPDTSDTGLDTATDAADAEDTGRDTGVGPCLSPPPPDTGRDTGVGPCLQPPLDTGEPDTSEGDTGDTSATDDATEVGALDPADERKQIVDKLGDRLPDDVLARLDSSDDEEVS